jgi:hypothetical protein
MDSKQYHQVTGARIGNINVWKSLAEMLLFFILNVAVGGGWVSFPFTLILSYYSDLY